VRSPGWTLPPTEVNVVPKTEPFTSVLWVNPEQAAAPLFDVHGSVARHLLGRDGADTCSTTPWFSSHLLRAAPGLSWSDSHPQVVRVHCGP
jgi:hypothetical protein